jgi:hypothetical protein
MTNRNAIPTSHDYSTEHVVQFMYINYTVGWPDDGKRDRNL